MMREEERLLEEQESMVTTLVGGPVGNEYAARFMQIQLQLNKDISERLDNIESRLKMMEDMA
jgi:hypothetical protein